MKIFRQTDTSGDNVLSLKEFSKGRKALAAPLEVAAAQLFPGIPFSIVKDTDIFMVFDIDGDESVSSEEFMTFCKGFMADPQTAITAAQKRLSKNPKAKMVVMVLSMANRKLADLNDQAKKDLQEGIKCAMAKAAGVPCADVQCKLSAGSIIAEVVIFTSND